MPGELGGSVDRVDYPTVVIAPRAVAEFLTEHIHVGKSFLDALSKYPFGLDVRRGDKACVCLLGNLETRRHDG